MQLTKDAAGGSTTGLKIHTSRSEIGKGDVEIPERKDPAEVRLNSCFDRQSSQSRTSSHPTRNIQAKPRCGNGQIALTGSMKSTSSAILETGLQ